MAPQNALQHVLWNTGKSIIESEKKVKKKRSHTNLQKSFGEKQYECCQIKIQSDVGLLIFPTR